MVEKARKQWKAIIRAHRPQILIVIIMVATTKYNDDDNKDDDNDDHDMTTTTTTVMMMWMTMMMLLLNWAELSPQKLKPCTEKVLTKAEKSTEFDNLIITSKMRQNLFIIYLFIFR